MSKCLTKHIGVKEGFFMQDKKKGGLFAGVFFGLILVIVGTVLLWWNEGNNVRNIKTTDEIEKTVVEIASKSDCKEYEDKLVATGGKFTVKDKELTDSTFNVSVHTAALSRIVEIYQWEEESETDDDGNTTYSYKKVWHEGLIDSSDFHRSGHDNPTSAAYKSEDTFAEEVILGNFHLSSTQIEKMSTNKELVPYEEMTIPEGYEIVGEFVTDAADLENPQIGDVRIKWMYNNWKEVSLIAQVKGTTFVSWTSEVGKKVNYVTGGNHTAAEMIQDMRTQDKIMKWLLRLAGFLAIFIGYMSFISPLTKLVGNIPFLGNVVNFMFFLTIFLLSLAQSLLVIIIAWFRFRPLLSIGLLAIVAVIGVLLFFLKKKPAQQNVQTA